MKSNDEKGIMKRKGNYKNAMKSNEKANNFSEEVAHIHT
jgi:hypothetical protein